MYASRVNASATLPGKEASLSGPRAVENQIHRDKDDGLAAILAAKIRTKAELKQVRVTSDFYTFFIFYCVRLRRSYDLLLSCSGWHRSVYNETTYALSGHNAER